MTRMMKASEFKADCLAEPVAELKPYRPKGKENLLGILKGQVEITGDIISPLDVEWDAMK